MQKPLILFFILYTSYSTALEDKNMIGYRVLEGEEITEKLSSGQPQNSQLTEEFSIVVWNLYKGIKKEGMQVVLPSLLDEMDIGIFQEYEANDFLKPIFSAPAFYSVAGLTHQYKNDDKTRAGVLIQSKVQAISNSCKAHHSQNRELGMSPKATLVCKFKLENSKELLIINVHALNFQIFNIGFTKGIGFGQAYRNQIAQWEEIIKDHNGPIILAGDFNTWNPMGRRLKRIYKMLERTNDGSSEGEFKHTNDYSPNHRGSFLTLDHIFYRGLEVVGNPYTKSTESASDHNPLFIKFKSL